MFSSDSESGDISDTELQDAFAAGTLKPGLHALVPHVKRETINNVNGLKMKLEEFKLELDWFERLDIICNPIPVEGTAAAVYGDVELKKTKKGKIIDGDDPVHNDFKREMTFYRQAQAAVMDGLPRLHALKMPTKRPDDYFAQMAKSDDHMQKVREKLLEKQQSMEKSEKARKLRELKKYGKKIQKEVLQQRQKEKKDMLDSVKKYKKGQKESANSFLDDSSSSKRTPKNANRKPKNKIGQFKKDHKNSKYGYGGQKKRSKYNTSESASDVSGFKARKFSLPPGRKTKKMNTRPGKNKRQNMKNRKR